IPAAHRASKALAPLIPEAHRASKALAPLIPEARRASKALTPLIPAARRASRALAPLIPAAHRASNALAQPDLDGPTPEIAICGPDRGAKRFDPPKFQRCLTKLEILSFFAKKGLLICGQ